MGFLNLFKRKPEPKEEKTPSESNITILREASRRDRPCVPFIPIDALWQSLSVLKPEGFEGYFVARIPVLYPDGTIKYLYKEEFMLWTAVQGAMSNVESKGGMYFFLGLEQLMETYENTPNEYLNPQIFYQSNLSLFRVEFPLDQISDCEM